MSNYKIILILFPALFLFLVGCSEVSSTDASTSATTQTPITQTPDVTSNVAAASNSATVSSTFAGNESFTVDEIINTTNFWVGGAAGDEVKVTFDQPYTITELTIRTNNTSFSSSGGVITSGLRVLLSTDDATYSEVGIAFGSTAPLSCSAQNIGSGRVRCVLSSAVAAMYIKVIVTTDFATTEIYEIEALGS